MPSNDFIPFAVGGSANVEAQAAWAAEATLLANGFQSGVAPSAKFNKALRQSSIMAAVLAQFIVDNTGSSAIDDGTISALLSGLKSSVGGAAVQGAFKNLQSSATGLSANISVTVDEIIVENASNAYQALRSVSLTIAGTSVGVNALDAGTIAASTWYSVWVIWNGTTTAGLLSLSATAPTLPSGYTYKARVGWIRTDASGNKYPLSFVQFGRKVQYKVDAGSNLTTTPIAAYGSTTGASSLANFCPTTACAAHITGQSVAGTPAGTTWLIAPNANYTSANAPLYLGMADVASIIALAISDWITLEAPSIYVSSSVPNFACLINGWEDNL